VLVASTEVFDPRTGAFVPGPTMTEPRYKSTGGALLLGDGRVLVASGGVSAEVVDVADGTAVTVRRFAGRRSFATVSPLGDGDVLVLGGYDERIRLRGDAVILSKSALR
jgi:hypothetical protein